MRTDFALVDVAPGVAAVVFSVCGYFLYMITAFSAIAALLIGLSNNSAIEDVLRYPRPIIDETVMATAPEPTTLLNKSKVEEPKTKETVPARDNKDFGVVSVAKVDAAKGKPEIKDKPKKQFAQLHRLKVLARQRERQKGGYAVASGNIEGSGYRPGLDSQR